MRKTPSQDERIEKRRAQVARLERRIKSLTTRLRTALRSLAALERAKRKPPKPPPPRRKAPPPKPKPVKFRLDEVRLDEAMAAVAKAAKPKYRCTFCHAPRAATDRKACVCGSHEIEPTK